MTKDFEKHLSEELAPRSPADSQKKKKATESELRTGFAGFGKPFSELEPAVRKPREFKGIKQVRQFVNEMVEEFEASRPKLKPKPPATDASIVAAAAAMFVPSSERDRIEKLRRNVRLEESFREEYRADQRKRRQPDDSYTAPDEVSDEERAEFERYLEGDDEDELNDFLSDFEDDA